MISELYKQNPWWERDFNHNSIVREDYINSIDKLIKSREIVFITGLRRVGKTTIMKQYIKKLLERRIKPEDILFVNLDTFSLIDKSIHEIIGKYREIHKKKASDFFYLFLDEITSKSNFEQELKSLYDNDNIKIICSSSIATFMHDKKALLTGRTRTIEVLPLSFKEFLLFNKVEYSLADRALLDSYFKSYLETGGLPHYVLTKDEEYMEELINNIIYKDVIAYYKIKNETVVKELFILLLERVGSRISLNKLSSMLHLSVDSVKRYINYFKKAYLFYTIERYSKTLNERITSQNKIYVADVGIRNVILRKVDYGRNFENLVFLNIRNHDPKYYLNNGVEIDFIYDNKLIEAKYGKKILNDMQKKLFNELKQKDKIIVSDY